MTSSAPRPPVPAADTDRDGFSAPTREWIETAPLDERKRLGQYMTPGRLRERLLDRCDLRPGMRVLDPGAGTGEFLRSVLDRQPDAQAYGWEVDRRLVAAARRVVPEARLEVRCALAAGAGGGPSAGAPFDLVVGNPPYFQFRADAETRARFREVISGRVNIFALFFRVGLEALRPGGQLAFVAPPSMNAGAYFDRLRRYLVRRSRVEFLEICREPDLFHRANTAVQLIVLRAGEGASSGPHVARCDDPPPRFRRIVFTEDAGAFARRRAKGESLFRLGYEAATGTVVWNRHRAALRRRPDRASTLLIWSHNIGETLEVAGDRPKPQFIETDRRERGPAIVVNRVIGAVGKGKLRCALVPEGMEFVAENHVNVIRPRGGFAPRVTLEQLLAALRRETTAECARLITGNTQLSATELTHLLPL